MFEIQLWSTEIFQKMATSQRGSTERIKDSNKNPCLSQHFTMVFLHHVQYHVFGHSSLVFHKTTSSQVIYSCNVMRIMLCDEHQPRRYLAKSVHAVNGGSATEVDRYQNPEHDIRDNKISNAGKAPTQNSRGALASS